MTSKLTLRLDENLIERAKQQARARGTSVSAMVASYFSALEPEPATMPTGNAPTVSRLRGILSDASASRDAYREHLVEKYTALLR